ncbi:glycoside hydrolase family 35 protein [Granulicella arctica]|uniref:Beta-galactosidase n=1 Tax=Granulicella arctica TaxID=940613 RepID=A0A7Y9PE67_9BACT|nr:beta-galactosidase family protein [Granulicella arctica]NYF78060.1 beta-galactosidase [Granulicella arctica]
MRRFTTACLLAAALLAAAPSFGQQPQHSFKVEGGQFLLDGKPFRVISGEMHYPRIPRAYWRDRLRKAKAMGLNTITTYAFWNEHEPKPGVYDFSGNNDIAEFIREAQQEGLYVILRPGPYVCAEWEFGGYPSWLLKDHATVVRSSDPKFMEPSNRWIKRLGQEVAPLQIGNGGPIILVQVENEYGSFGKDHAYMEQNHQAILDAGFTKSQLYTADGPEQTPDGSLPELPVGINFGPDDADSAQKAFATLKKFRPEGPFFNSEYWAGWFDHWGDKHAHTDTAKQVANLDWMLKQGYSVSVYMFHGGTSFGWMNGANSDGKNYQPDVTSYDYDSALDESGRPTPKYYAFRDVIAKDTGVTPPPVPQTADPIAVSAFPLVESVSLWGTLPKPVESAQPLSMEDLDQSYGYILYRTQLAGAVSGELKLDAVHDYAQVYLDGKLVGTIDRRLGQSTLPLQVAGAKTQLDILVENSGRVNYTTVLRGERKGITKEVTLAGKPVTGWQIYSLPMLDPAKLPYRKTACTGPCFSRATFKVAAPADTFLDTSALGKGEVWLNGRPLGRFWDVGPQKALYVPGPWLKQGKNEVVVFDVAAKPGATLRGLTQPDLDGKTTATSR